MRATAITRGVSPGAGNLCTADAVDGQSEPDYQGTYAVTDQRGGRHVYSGPLHVTLGVDVYQDQHGTYGDPNCTGTAGFEQPVRSASLASPPGGTGSVACSYDATRSTYSRREQNKITIKLVGTCDITQGGVTYSANTVETRHGQVFETTYARGAPTGTGVTIRWSESYSYITTCVSASCAAPARPSTPSIVARLPGPGPGGGVGPVGAAPARPGEATAGHPGSGQAPSPAGAGPPSAHSPAGPTTGSMLAEAGDDDAWAVDAVPQSESGDTGRGLPRPLVVLALLVLVGEVANYRKQKHAGRPVFPLLARLRLSSTR